MPSAAARKQELTQAIERAWEPTPRQAEFLAASEKEVLYGGAAGGGKTDGIIIDSLGLAQRATEYSSYRAVIFRRTYKELTDLIDRAREVIGIANPGAVYNQVDHCFKFPSGAKLTLDHMHHPQDRYKHRGRAYQYIGWEELTLWSSDVEYVYLKSRLRSVETRLDCYIRATTNPDGPGQGWVKKRWAIPNEGTATCFHVEVVDEVTGERFVEWLRFIPALLTDNPYLSQTDYRIALLRLPPEEREALLRGRWDAIGVRGAYYGEHVAAMKRDGRVTRVPYQPGVPVDTYWDLGHSDTTAILWHQEVNLQDRILRAYENSGESLDHYAKQLTDQPYVYGTHWLPHDAAYVRLGKDEASTKSWKQMLEELLPNHRFEVVPRIDDVTRGIEQTRRIFANLWVDEIECAGLLSALENYRKEWDEKRGIFKDKPLHDWASNYADALRQLGQRRGNTWTKRSPRDELDDPNESWRTI